jgi:hypothetical protein
MLLFMVMELQGHYIQVHQLLMDMPEGGCLVFLLLLLFHRRLVRLWQVVEEDKPMDILEVQEEIRVPLGDKETIRDILREERVEPKQVVVQRGFHLMPKMLSQMPQELPSLVEEEELPIMQAMQEVAEVALDTLAVVVVLAGVLHVVLQAEALLGLFRVVLRWSILQMLFLEMEELLSLGN